MMWRALLRSSLGFASQEIETVINLKCVRVNDLGANLLSYFRRNGRLTDCGRAYDKENTRHKKIGRRAAALLRLPIDEPNQLRACSLDFAPLTTSLRPRNSLS